MQIPGIDLHACGRATDEALGAGLRDFGFVAVRGHGVPEGLLEDARRVAREFFALSEARKRALVVPGGAGQRGYTPLAVETARDQTRPDLKEFFHVGREPGPGNAYPENVWPEGVPGFREVLRALFAELDRVGLFLLRRIARFLDLEEDFFDGRVQGGNSILRILHYPPLQGGGHGVRSAAHEDINLVTLLAASHEPGLEILHRGGTWIPVVPEPGVLVCNGGDMLQRITNGMLPSTTHRVVNPPLPWSERSRTSMPFFVHPSAGTVLDVLPGCITAERPCRYPERITADAFLRRRLREIRLLGEDGGES